MEDLKKDQAEIINTIDKIWKRYDKDGNGVLQKIEVMNFLNEFLKMKGEGPITVDHFNQFFDQYDTNKDGEIDKGEMSVFIRAYISSVKPK